MMSVTATRSTRTLEEKNKPPFTPTTGEYFSQQYKKFSQPKYIKIITPPLTALFRLLKQNPDISWYWWLDLGCGAGVCFPHFPKTTEVVAIDYASKLIQQAQKNINKNRLHNITCLQQDIHNLNLGQDNFDGAMLFQVYPHLRHGVLNSIQHFIKPGGYIVIAYGADLEQIERTHHRHPELSSRPIPLKIHMMMDMVGAGFKFIDEINLDPQEVSQVAKLKSKRPLIAYLGKKF